MLVQSHKEGIMKFKKKSNLFFVTILILFLFAPLTVNAQGLYQFVTKWGSSGTDDGLLNLPNGVAVDSSGNVYVADTNNNRIQTFTSTGTFITKWGSTVTCTTLTSGTLIIGQEYEITTFVAGDDFSNVGGTNVTGNKFTATRTTPTNWIHSSSLIAIPCPCPSGTGNGQFNSAGGVAVDSSGNVYVADTNNNRIQKFTSSGAYMTQWGSSGSGDGQFSNPNGVAVDSSGNVYVADTYNNRIQKFTSTGTLITKWGSSGFGDGQLSNPSGVVVDSLGNIYVADRNNNRIQKFTSTGTLITKWGSSGSGNGQFNYPSGVAVDSSGNVYVADTNNSRIQKFTSTGAFMTTWGSIGSDNGKFYYPGGVVVDSSENVYVADTNSNRIQKFSPLSAIVTTNSVGPRNTIKITDMSGSLSASGGAITVAAWDVNGNALPLVSGAPPLVLLNNSTTTITGTALAAMFTGTPVTYEFTVASSKVIITNVKSSTDGSINIPSVYTNGLTNFATNSVGPRNTIKITDMSGSISASGGAITVAAWDVNGNALPLVSTAPSLVLLNNATTTITGTTLAAMFTGTPMTYSFTVASSKVIITNVKSSTDGSINIPSVYTNGFTNFATNSVGPLNTIKITDMSGSLSASGGAITVAAWDVNGNALPLVSTAPSLVLLNNATTTITGTTLAAMFTGTPMTYSFTVASSKVIITNVKNSTDGSINIPTSPVYTNGFTNFATNSVGPLNAIKITDMSGALPVSGGAITVQAWQANGYVINESSYATPLTLSNHGTTTIAGSDLAARFPSGTPTTYSFTVGSSRIIITNVKSNASETLNIPTVYISGVGGGI